MVIGVHLLKTILASDTAPTLAEIAVAAGLSSGRTERFLAGLIQAGLVVREHGSGRYFLGETICDLATVAFSRMDPVRRGIAALSGLTVRTGLVSFLSTWGTHGPTIVKWEQGRKSTAIWFREGCTLPLLTTATGHLFLAFMPDSQTGPLVERELACLPDRRDGRTAHSPEDMQALRQEVRRRGLAHMIGEGPGALVTIAAPVFDHEGQIAMAMTLVGIIGCLDADDGGAPTGELRATADWLSRRLGAPPRR